MPGQKISSLSPVSDLQAADQLVLARSGSTYKITGDKFASKAQLDSLSATSTGSFATKTQLTSLSSNASPFLVTATGSTTARTLANRFADFVSPLDFGAVGDGSTNDLAAVKLALESGRPVDGGGRTYGISGSCTPTSIVGLQNANFIQLAPTTASVATINIIDKSDFFIDNVKINMGSVENTGASDDSSKSGLRIVSSNENTLFNENFRITRVTVTGNGNGSRIQIRSGKRFTVDNCLVTDCIAAFSPDPTNDIMNGIDIGACANYTLSNTNVYNLQTRLTTGLTRRFTRGILITESRDCTIIGCNVTNVDQGFDFSGGIANVTYQGNRRWTLSGCTANNALTYGFKFANVAHNGLVTGCIANNSGFCGFVVSPSANYSIDPSYQTQEIDFVGCKVVNVTGEFNGNAQGFRIMAGGTVTDYPRGIRFISCSVQDTQTPITTLTAFASDVVKVKYPTTGYDKAIANQIIGCTSDAGITHSSGISPNICQVTGTATQTITSASYQELNWDQNFIDFTGLHNTASNNSLMFVKTPGWYRVSAQIEFAANATGKRALRFTKNGVVIDRTTVQLVANSEILTLSTNTVVFLSSGDNIGVWAFQNSGGNLNVNSNESHFMITKIDG